MLRTKLIAAIILLTPVAAQADSLHLVEGDEWKVPAKVIWYRDFTDLDLGFVIPDLWTHITGDFTMSATSRLVMGGDQIIDGALGTYVSSQSASRLGFSEGSSIQLSGTLVVESGLVGYEGPYSAFGEPFQLFDWQQELEESNRFDSIELPYGTWDLSQLYNTGHITQSSYYPDLGDFTHEGDITSHDMDRLTMAVNSGEFLCEYAGRPHYHRNSMCEFDLNADEMLNQDDRLFWLRNVAETQFGDLNLDGRVSLVDFLVLSRGFGQRGNWADGDSDGDGIVDFSDYLTLAANFGQAVPEPSTLSLLLPVTLCMFAMRRRSRSLSASTRRTTKPKRPSFIGGPAEQLA